MPLRGRALVLRAEPRRGRVSAHAGLFLLYRKPEATALRPAAQSRQAVDSALDASHTRPTSPAIPQPVNVRKDAALLSRYRGKQHHAPRLGGIINSGGVPRSPHRSVRSRTAAASPFGLSEPASASEWPVVPGAWGGASARTTSRWIAIWHLIAPSQAPTSASADHAAGGSSVDGGTIPPRHESGTRNLLSKPLAATGPKAALGACHYPVRANPHPQRLPGSDRRQARSSRRRALVGATPRVAHRARRGATQAVRAVTREGTTTAPSSGGEAGAPRAPRAKAFGPGIAKPAAGPVTRPRRNPCRPVGRDNGTRRERFLTPEQSRAASGRSRARFSPSSPAAGRAPGTSPRPPWRLPSDSRPRT